MPSILQEPLNNIDEYLEKSFPLLNSLLKTIENSKSKEKSQYNQNTGINVSCSKQVECVIQTAQHQSNRNKHFKVFQEKMLSSLQTIQKPIKMYSKYIRKPQKYDNLQ